MERPSGETINVGINGGGRIGGLAMRALFESDEHTNLKLTHLNEPYKPIELIAAGLKRDTVHREFDGEVSIEGDNLVVNGQTISVTREFEPSELPWQQVYVALECTGKFVDPAKAAEHFKNGAKRVLISAPAKPKNPEDQIPTIVYGVNHNSLRPEDKLVSGASCTTNALAPVVKVLDGVFGIESGFMTTFHAATNGQPPVDNLQKIGDRRGRSMLGNMIPTTTGAAKAIGLVLPELEGKLNGDAVRVDVPDGSMIKLVVNLKELTTVDRINRALQFAVKAQDCPLEVVKASDLFTLADVIGNTTPSIVDLGCTAVAGIEGESQQHSLTIWYDNEKGYVAQLLRTAERIGELIK